MVPAQLFAWQQGRKQHDQQRPEVVDQARFDGRRVAQRKEVQEMVAEEATDAQGPDRQRLAQGAERLWSQGEQ